MKQSSAVAAVLAQLYSDIAPRLRDILGNGHFGGLLLSMLLWKYLSDINADRRELYLSQYRENLDIVDKLMMLEPYKLPIGTTFDDIYQHRRGRIPARDLAEVFREIERANFRLLIDVLRGPAASVLGVTWQDSMLHSLNDILSSVMDRLSQPDMNFRPSKCASTEIVGDAYAELVCHFAAHDDPIAANASVPLALCDLATELVQPQEYESIYDPNCGAGGFLFSCAQFIRNQFNSRKYSLTGQVESHSIFVLAKANMIAYGELETSIARGDALSAPNNVDDTGALNRFDIVLGRVPFMLEQWNQQLGFDDKYERFSRGIPVKSKPDFAYISHMIASMNDSGRMAVIAPIGVLFRGYAESDIRQSLINENLLDAVIRLPDRLFYDTTLPAVVLIFKKNRIDNDVLFIDASNEFTFGRRHNEMHREHVGKIVATYRHRQSIAEFSRSVSIEEIRTNDYNLNISRYIYNQPATMIRSLDDIHAERARLEGELSAAQERIARYLNRIYG